MWMVRQVITSCACLASSWLPSLTAEMAAMSHAVPTHILELVIRSVILGVVMAAYHLAWHPMSGHPFPVPLLPNTEGHWHTCACLSTITSVQVQCHM